MSKTLEANEKARERLAQAAMESGYDPMAGVLLEDWLVERLQEPPGEGMDPTDYAIRGFIYGSDPTNCQFDDGTHTRSAREVENSQPATLIIHDPDPEPEYDADRIAILAKHLGEGS